ncbi:MAG: nascent polypeptide-associated complex protein [Candidatus Micrarchaeota archaeon]
MDPKKMDQMMRQMGITSRKIEAKRVIIEVEDGRYIVTEPDVVEVDMRGQKSLQISGNMSFEEGIKAEDVKMVAEQAGCSEEEAKQALQKTSGDIAEAIILLKEK